MNLKSAVSDFMLAVSKISQQSAVFSNFQQIKSAVSKMKSAVSKLKLVVLGDSAVKDFPEDLAIG